MNTILKTSLAKKALSVDCKFEKIDLLMYYGLLLLSSIPINLPCMEQFRNIKCYHSLINKADYDVTF